MTMIFVGGMFSSNTKIEKVAEYVTDIAVNHTSDKSICALTVGKTEKSGPLLNPDSEFHNTYGTFMQQRIAFASAVNPDKERQITFENIQTDNLSMLYGGAVGTIPYNNHYKHNTLPIEIMFVDERMYDISNYVIYLSQNQADSLLDSYEYPRQDNGFHTEDEYRSLLKTMVPISIDGQVTEFVIQNIYYQINYYYDSLFEVMGEFVIFSYYLPNDLRSEQRNMYFMDEYVYHNKYFMNYIVAAYPSRNFSLKINHFNLVDQIDDNYLTSFYYLKNSENLDWLNVIFLIIAILLLLFSLFLVFCVGFKKKSVILNSVLYLAVLFTPYVIFSIIFKITGNVYFMSETASKTNFFTIIIYGFVYIMLLIFGKTIFKMFTRMDRKDFYEIDI